MKAQSTPTADQLVPTRAFVVHLRQDSNEKTLRGRVEHVVSGQAAPFESLDELAATMTATLAAVAANKP